MISHKFVRNIFLITLVLCNIGCDQGSKSFVRKNVDENRKIDFVKGHLSIQRAENTGAFLSFGDTWPKPVRFILLSLSPLLILLIMGWQLLSKSTLPFLMAVSLTFFIGGGIGNLYDRISLGSVTDFLHIDYGLFQTGIFNLADVSIMTGIGLFLLSMYVKPMKDQLLHNYI